ncbi:serine hydrolase domain-containing protein [Yoonia sp. MH D7]
MLKWVARALAGIAVVAVCVGLWKREEIMRLLAVNSLFSETKIVHNFSHMNEAFLTAPLPRAVDDPAPLLSGFPAAMPPQVPAWVVDRSVTSLVILKDGAIVFEDYFLGTQPRDLRINWSVSKSYLSILFGILLDEGVIASIDDPVVKYAPGLVGSAYEAVSIKNVLQMSSGVVFDEDYLDPSSDINKMGRVLALGGSMDEFAAALVETDAEPGARWQYVSIDTHVIGMVIRGATGRDIADLMVEKVIGPMGLEADPYYLTDGFGVAFVLGGLNTTTRDNARFGQMVAQGGLWEGQQIVPTAWIDESTAPSANTVAGEIGYGYQWWVPAGAADGQFMARGIYGQYIYIDQGRNVVISTHAADRDFRAAGAFEQNIAAFRAIAESLD